MSTTQNTATAAGSMMCVNRACTGLCTRLNISSREENIVSIVQTLAKTSSGVLLTVLVTFVKKN